jgi:hypothetical protein
MKANLYKTCEHLVCCMVIRHSRHTAFTTGPVDLNSTKYVNYSWGFQFHHCIWDESLPSGKALPSVICCLLPVHTVVDVNMIWVHILKVIYFSSTEYT